MWAGAVGHRLRGAGMAGLARVRLDHLSLVKWDFAGISSKLKEVAQSLFVAGTVIGGIVPGNLSDK